MAGAVEQGERGGGCGTAQGRRSAPAWRALRQALEACLGIRLDWLLPATARSPWAQAWLAEERDRGLQQSPMAFPLGLLWEQSSVSI